MKFVFQNDFLEIFRLLPLFGGFFFLLLPLLPFLYIYLESVKKTKKHTFLCGLVFLVSFHSHSQSSFRFLLPRFALFFIFFLFFSVPSCRLCRHFFFIWSQFVFLFFFSPSWLLFCVFRLFLCFVFGFNGRSFSLFLSLSLFPIFAHCLGYFFIFFVSFPFSLNSFMFIHSENDIVKLFAIEIPSFILVYILFYIFSGFVLFSFELLLISLSLPLSLIFSFFFYLLSSLFHFLYLSQTHLKLWTKQKMFYFFPFFS